MAEQTDRLIAAVKERLTGILIEYWNSQADVGVPYRRMASEATAVTIELLEQLNSNPKE